MMPRWLRLFSNHGMVAVLVLLCAFYSAATLAEQNIGGAAGGEALAEKIIHERGSGVRVAIVAGSGADDGVFAQVLQDKLVEAGVQVVLAVKGPPRAARLALTKLDSTTAGPDVIAASYSASRWSLLAHLDKLLPKLAGIPVVRLPSYVWPNFLRTDNLLNIANQIAVIAIIAIGMTLVIVSGGIDLSVGSLIALSAVLATLLIRDAANAEEAAPGAMVLCCLAAILVCAGVGLFTGAIVTYFAVPPFIVTLGMMLVAGGLAEKLSANQSIYHLPESFVWLGRGADLAGIPNAVVLMGLLYVTAHVLMTRTTLGRYIYAVGGNAEAARLSGVRVERVRLFVYALCAALAGVGGVIMASQLKSGAPTYGQMYELYVIAAVVVGGTSLSGGEGRVMGTLIGALVIAVIRNGMNLTGVESSWQKIVLGSIIVAAVLVDRLKARN
ncbi:MAG: ABC transporter permease [Planctomycetes bacterium]|nr:ABC transporter permease [Planctomycetota bacterium]